MDGTHAYFLHLMGCALSGGPPEAPSGLTMEQWDSLFRLAQAHHVLPLVFEAACRLPELKNTPLMAGLKRQVIRQVLVQTQKTAEFHKVLEALRSAGATPLVVKGILCRSLYPLPDHRSSSDEDVLIPPEQSALCHAVLTRMGLQGDGGDASYEVPYRQENGPLYIELHRYLFPPESDSYGDLNRFFRDVRDRAIEETVDGFPVPTLGYTDHLFFLICHAYKHFLHSGFGIRQVCDIVLFANTHGSRVDWELLLKNCREIRAHLFTVAMFRIGERFLTFDPLRACYPSVWSDLRVDEAPMLTDLLDAGVYGDATMSRKHSSNITLDAVAARNRGSGQGHALAASLFPPAKKLEGRYPYLKDRPYLLPAAWASRMGTYLLESRNRKGNSASEALSIGKERLELLRIYEIIK